eukprot:5267890-Amphidinium_carterae.1
MIAGGATIERLEEQLAQICNEGRVLLRLFWLTLSAPIGLESPFQIDIARPQFLLWAGWAGAVLDQRLCLRRLTPRRSWAQLRILTLVEDCSLWRCNAVVSRNAFMICMG